MSTRRAAERQLAQQLAAQGRYPARQLERDPKIISLAQSWLVQGPQQGDARVKVWEHCKPQSASYTDATARLRQIKARVSLALYALEASGSWPVARCTASLSELAGACLDAALLVAARHEGWPEAVEHVCVMGLGKLGGWELNYGSDVDVVFVCSEQGWAERERLERVLRGAIALMADVTEDGYVFRVDLRLRPDGGQGLLVLSDVALAQYYLRWGQTWERSAWLKARPVAGALGLGEGLLKSLEPFLYKKYLDMQVFEDLRRMKATVEQNARLDEVRGQAPAPQAQASKPLGGGLGLGLGSSLGSGGGWRPGAGLKPAAPAPRVVEAPSEARDVYGWDVKIGEGGIREVEFFVQALQLVHSGSRPELRVRGTMEALDRLLYAGLITGEDHAALADSYTLYRLVEHRVQLEEDQQTHKLPATREGFLELSRRMGRAVDELREALMGARGRVRAIFSRLFEAPASAGGRPVVRVRAPLVAALAAPAEELEGERGAAWLEQAGFVRPRQVVGQLWVMRQKAWGPFGWRADGAQRALAGELMEAAAQSPDPVRAVAYLTRLVTTVGDRPWFWRMLADNLSAARLVAQVCGASEVLGGIVSREPQVVGRLLSSGSVVARQSATEVSGALSERLSGALDPGEAMRVIHRFVQEEQLRIGLHELGGAVGIERTMAQLTWLAEATLGEVVRLVAGGRDDLGELAIVALGKLGGRELTFGSDLDLMFVCEGDSQRVVRAVQRLLRELGGISTGGELYEVDTRLRPSGRQGALVVPLDVLESYHASGHAGLWERQAMIKARPMSGSAALRAGFEAMRRRVVFEAPLPDDAGATIRAMREKMREAAGVAELGADVFDVKLSPGGVVDIEFMVQAAQLEHQVEGRGTLEALSALERIGAPGDWRALSLDYVWLRRLEARLRLERLGGRAVLRRGECGAVARQMGLMGEDGGEALWAMVAARRAGA